MKKISNRVRDEDKKLKLNREQKQAIEYNNGPLLIIAGAGTGKTTVITEKIRYLIDKKKAKPEEILALTFTEKAATEMEERVDKIMPYGYFQMWISTFHYFADQILRNEIAAIGLSSAYKLMTEAESVIFLRDHLFLFDLKYFRPLGNPNKFTTDLLDHFSRLKDENVSPQEYLKWSLRSKDPINIELARAYETYQKIKIKGNYFDFSDLIFYLIQLFKKRPNILQRYRKQFKYILVDEFQDTNIAQYDLIKMLAPATNNPQIAVVGDDSQAIYKFRGASVSNILNFMKDYKTAKQITLNQNYRSNQKILDSAYQLIKNNDPDTLETQLKISKNLTAQMSKSIGNELNFYFGEDASAEAEYVAETILKLKKKHKLKYEDFAVLVRANNHADPFIRNFIYKGIPYQFLGPGMLFKQPEVKDLIAYLNILSDVEDSVSVYRVLTMDILDIDKKDIHLLLSLARKTGTSLLKALEIYLKGTSNYKPYIPTLVKDSEKKLFEFFKMFDKHLKLVRKDSAGQILYYFLEDTKYLNKLARFKTEQEEKIATNISKFFNKLKDFEQDHEDSSVFAIVDYIKMSMELGESPYVAAADIQKYDAVNVLTVHSAKGLEWPIVFIVNLTKDRFPTRERKEKIPIPQELIKETLPYGDYHLLEERRLFYVAATRAMMQLHLTGAKFYGEGKRERKLSNFVFESLDQELIQKGLEVAKDESKLSLQRFKTQEAEIIKKEVNINNFSYSQIDNYLLCPLKYKYQFILKIPYAPHFSASFGTTIHTALEQFYKEFKVNNKLGKARLIGLYEHFWIPIGYSSQNHEEKVKKEGKKLLNLYFKNFHDPKNKIIDIERSFKIKIDKDIFITGKIDRVDQRSNGEIEIVDYKTGKKPDERELRKNLQLSIYLLAATSGGFYSHRIEDVTLSFLYLKDQQKVSFQKTIEDIEGTKDKVKETVAKIRAGRFEPHVGIHCNFCPFKMICEAWQ